MSKLRNVHWISKPSLPVKRKCRSKSRNHCTLHLIAHKLHDNLNIKSVRSISPIKQTKQKIIKRRVSIYQRLFFTKHIFCALFLSYLCWSSEGCPRLDTWALANKCEADIWRENNCGCTATVHFNWHFFNFDNWSWFSMAYFFWHIFHKKSFDHQDIVSSCLLWADHVMYIE